MCTVTSRGLAHPGTLVSTNTLSRATPEAAIALPTKVESTVVLKVDLWAESALELKSVVSLANDSYSHSLTHKCAAW